MGRDGDLKTRSCRKDDGSSNTKFPKGARKPKELQPDKEVRTVQTAEGKTRNRLLSINRTLKSGHTSRRQVIHWRNFNQTMESGNRNYSADETEERGLGRSSDGSCTLDSLSGALTGTLVAALWARSVFFQLISKFRAIGERSLLGNFCSNVLRCYYSAHRAI